MQRETRETGVTFPKIKHHGAVQGVTGSCHELQVSDASAVLIDCGLFQGMERSAEGADSDRLAIDFPVETIEALLVTHCHIDHVGRIPYLLAAGSRDPSIAQSRPRCCFHRYWKTLSKLGLPVTGN